MSPWHNCEFPWIIVERYVERRGDKLHFSAFVACMKHSEQGVMMQGKLGDCGGTFLFPRRAPRVECGASVISREEPEPLISAPAPRMADHTHLTHGNTQFLFTVYMNTCTYTHTHTHVYSTHVLAHSLTRAHTHWHGRRSKETLKRSSKAGFLSSPLPLHFTLKRTVALKKHCEERYIIYDH